MRNIIALLLLLSTQAFGSGFFAGGLTGTISGTAANLDITDTLTFHHNSTLMMTISSLADRIKINADVGVFQFYTANHSRLYVADDWPQVTTLGADLWMEPGDGGATQGSIGALTKNVSDIGYVARQDVLGAEPGFHPFRYFAISNTMFFVPYTEAAGLTPASSTVPKMVFNGTIAAANRTLVVSNIEQAKWNGASAGYFQMDFGLSGTHRVITNRDFWIDDAKLIFYGSTAAKSRAGTATLVGGSVTISNTTISATDKIFVTRNTIGGTTGLLYAPDADVSAGVSFKIKSESASDTSTVNWMIINKQ